MENSLIQAIMKLFAETFEKSIDSQCRLALPAQWRTEGEETDRFVVLMLPDHLLRLIPSELFEDEVLKKAGTLPLADPEAFTSLASLGAIMRECVCDRQGRIQLSQGMLDHAQIREKAVLAGAVTTAMILSPERWKELNSPEEDKALDLLDRLHRIGRESR